MADSTGRTRLTVRAQPGAANNAIVGWDSDGALRIRLTAPPIDGRANQALIAFLADRLGIRKSAISLIRGDTARLKTVEVADLDLDAIRQRLSAPGGRA